MPESPTNPTTQTDATDLHPMGCAVEPTQLRWGLDDVMWVDNDSTTVMLSGPAGEPYSLELDADRTVALREALARPHGEQDLATVERSFLRARIARAICEASGFEWDPDSWEPDEFGDHAEAVLAVLPTPTDQTSELTELRAELDHWRPGGKDGYGTPVHWTVYNDMHKRALAAEYQVEDLRAGQADVLREAADAARAEAERLEVSNHDPRAARGARSAAYLIRRMADEAQQAEPVFSESVIYQVVGDWGVETADSANEARAAVTSWLADHPQSGAHAQQRVRREWPNGAEFYGPWTALPPIDAEAQQSGAK